MGGAIERHEVSSGQQAYIADVIAKVAGDWPASRWDELMPWDWRPDFQGIAEAV